MSIKCKTFDAYLKEIVYHPERSKKWLNDRRLTLIEKKILSCYMLIRDNKNAEVIPIIEQLPASDIDFVNHHKNLLLGISYNNTGKFDLAEKLLKNSVQDFEQSHQPHHLFTTLFNLLMIKSNTGKFSEMPEILSKMENLRPDGKQNQIRFLRCQYIYATDVCDHEQTAVIAKKINKIKKDMSESDLIQHLVCEFMYQIKVGQINEANETLVAMKSHRKYMLSENFIFMKKLMDYLLKDSSIYVYEREFPVLKILYHQIKVIEALQAKNQQAAQTYWNILAQTMPEVFLNNFEYRAETCIFSVCLAKALNHKAPAMETLALEEDMPKHKKGFLVLEKAEAPVPKEELFKLIYGKEMEDKTEAINLSNLIAKIRTIYQVEISYKKSTYQIKK